MCLCVWNNTLVFLSLSLSLSLSLLLFFVYRSKRRWFLFLSSRLLFVCSFGFFLIHKVSVKILPMLLLPQLARSISSLCCQLFGLCSIVSWQWRIVSWQWRRKSFSPTHTDHVFSDEVNREWRQKRFGGQSSYSSCEREQERSVTEWKVLVVYRANQSTYFRFSIDVRLLRHGWVFEFRTDCWEHTHLMDVHLSLC